jgi:hypothetical protein
MILFNWPFQGHALYKGPKFFFSQYELDGYQKTQNESRFQTYKRVLVIKGTQKSYPRKTKFSYTRGAPMCAWEIRFKIDNVRSFEQEMEY